LIGSRQTIPPKATLIPSELALIQSIRRQAASLRPGPALQIGIGDDCAVLRPRPGYEICLTTDFSLEGVHFRRDWHPPQSVGHRCLARGLSDLAAMGADPLAVFLSLALPVRLPRAWLDAFLQGFLALARKYRVPLAGGDTAQSPGPIAADIVALGQLPRNTARLRSTARPGDLLYVTGSLGGSAAELLALSSRPASRRASALKGHSLSRAINAAKKEGASAPEAMFHAHPHLYPQPRLAIGRRLRPLVHAIIDISDGLSTDLTHLCEESGLAAVLDEAALPIHPLALEFRGQARPAATGPSPLHLALHGGEDYELLFSAPTSAKIPRSIAAIPIHPIGVLRKPLRNHPRILLKTRDGRIISVTPAGWEHFR
jgi:thiamine-monophosphate kinase